VPLLINTKNYTTVQFTKTRWKGRHTQTLHLIWQSLACVGWKC